MEVIICIILFIFVSGLIMIGTNILYDFASAIIPVVAIFVLCLGIIVGFTVAIKNTVIAYKQTYFKKGK